MSKRYYLVEDAWNDERSNEVIKAHLKSPDSALLNLNPGDVLTASDSGHKWSFVSQSLGGPLTLATLEGIGHSNPPTVGEKLFLST